MIIENLMKVALLGSEWVLYLLIVLSVLSVTTMIERSVFFLRRRVDVTKLRNELDRAPEAGDVAAAQALLSGSRSVQAQVALHALHWLPKGPDALVDAVDAELSRQRTELEKGGNLLGTLGNYAQFVGLLVTVLGVIIAFDALNDAGGNAGAMGGVMAGIAEALVATGVGLFVALPAVVAYNILQKAIGDIENEALALVKLITAHAKGSPALIERAKALVLDRAKAVAYESATETSSDAARYDAAAVPEG